MRGKNLQALPLAKLNLILMSLTDASKIRMVDFLFSFLFSNVLPQLA